MALIKFGGGITAMSGSMAGNTFARNHYGNYVRSRTKPVNKNSDRQNAVRNTMMSIADRWTDTLTQAQRNTWNDFAANVPVNNKLGESITLSGFNQFIRSNTAIINAGLDVVDDAPAIFTMPVADPTVAVTYVAATQLMSVVFDETADWVKEVGAALLVYQGAPQSAGVNFFNGPWRFCKAILGVTSTGASSPDSAASVYTIAVGQKDTVQFRVLRADGRLSNFFRAVSDIVA